MAAMALCWYNLRVALIVCLITLTTENSQTIRPHCQEKCGNVSSITYPSVTSEDCSLNSDFFISCNTSHFPPKPFLWNVTSNFEVLEVWQYGYVRVNTPVAYDCCNETGMQVSAQNAFMALQEFPFSVTLRKFVGIGCDTLAVINGKNGNNYSTGCLSLCSSIDSSTNGSCSGIGCCEISIPRNLLVYEARPLSFRNHTGLGQSSPWINFESNATEHPVGEISGGPIDYAANDSMCSNANGR